MEPTPPGLELDPVPNAGDLEFAYAGRVLVVDDEPSVVDVFREYLSAQGYELSVATSGEEAIRLLPELRPDLILTDINLPGLSGLDLMRHAKSEDAELVVIVVTGHASASSAIDALRQGAYDYITKPFDLDEVHQIVERGIANRRLTTVNRRLLEELRQKNEILQHHENLLRERVRHATRQMTLLYEVGKEVSANLELAPRLGVVCGKALELSGAQAAMIFLRQDESDEFHPAAAAGIQLALDESGSSQVLVPGPLLWGVHETRSPVRRGVGEGGTPFVIPGVAHTRARTLLALPMLTAGSVMGVLALLEKPGGFTEDDQKFMMLFASQAAIAVRNSQLFEHTKSLDRLKSEFVAVVSHEIRTPLTSVKGALELLGDERYFQNSEQQGKLLNIAHANSERLLVLINDILDFSKLEASSLPMTIERQRLEPVVQQAVHNLRTLLEERRIRLETRLSEALPDLLMDSNRVTQVITNLLSNAIKFSPAGGRIEIEAEPWEGGVRVGVHDSGEGIGPEHLPKLFRKFSQIDSGSTRKAGGTGLGLVICKGIIEQHGGKIWVESTPPDGSVFHFTLPSADAAASKPDASAAPGLTVREAGD
ncbi:MAG: hypothetical protein A2W00_13265 [Candidatus Eisenbacteria bacterium RBG_16_71_46]|nr:MAG: hypothetical protein A2W00_13265 [Candidatus Eisenbacteria bacterium RBG_16_71_46]OGF24211.1 MAG: hypothetical protein A2V63_00810 [Candidatus Eisenbacteria bacterium RBG_19FT_COMBO_70_11]